MEKYKYVTALAERLHCTAAHSAGGKIVGVIAPVLISTSQYIDTELLMSELSRLYDAYTDLEFCGADKALYFCPLSGEVCADFMHRIVKTLYRSANAVYANKFGGVVCIDLSDYSNDAYNLLVRTVLSYVRAHKSRIGFVILLGDVDGQSSELLEVAAHFTTYFLIDIEQPCCDMSEEVRMISEKLNITLAPEAENRVVEYFSATCKAVSYIHATERTLFLLDQAFVENHCVSHIGLAVIECTIENTLCLKLPQ